MSTTIYGKFLKSMWRNEKDGKSYFLLKTMHDLFIESMYINKEIIKKKEVNQTWYTIIVDASDISIPIYIKDTPLKLEGTYIPKENMTWEFKAENINETSNDEEMTINYLVSAFGEYITLEKAEIIVGKTGADIHSFIRNTRNHVNIISDVSGVEPELCQEMCIDILKSTYEKELFDLLSKADIPYAYCCKAIRLYEKKAIEKFIDSPYRTGFKIGLSFMQCDKIACLLKKNAYETERLRSACIDVMDMFATQGHIYSPISLFEKQVRKKLTQGAFSDNVPCINVLSVIPEHYGITRINDELCIYSEKLINAEKRVARNIQRLSQGKQDTYSNDLIEYAEKACNISYGKQQRQSFPTSLAKRGIKIITGGPGTGKTTTIKGIILAYQRMHPNHNIKLCAPTGRAAQRMSESTGMEATTVHRLLDYKPYGDNVTFKDANDPISADLIVVDEMSMMDIVLFDMLLEAIRTDTTVVLVGDIHQLESVGPGAVLHDLLKSSDNLIQKCILTDVFRQKENSPIIDNSDKINKGNINLTECDDFCIIKTKDEEESQKQIEELMNKLYDKSNPFRVQILCPARTGMAGIDNLNQKLQAQLNSDGESLIYGKNTFRISDKVIMTRNNYFLDYFNGDIGVITDITEHGIMIKIRNNSIQLEKEFLEDVSLAYAMTIHKSQGSEFETVIISMPMQPQGMLTKNLFYTAVTRSKKNVYIVNENSAMQTAIKVDKTGCRRTSLASFLPAL